MKYVLNMILNPGSDLESLRVACVAAARSAPTVSPMISGDETGLMVAEVRSDVEAELRGLIAALEPTGMICSWHMYDDAPVDMPMTAVVMPPVAE